MEFGNLGFDLGFEISLWASFGNWNSNLYQRRLLEGEQLKEMECRCDAQFSAIEWI